MDPHVAEQGVLGAFGRKKSLPVADLTRRADATVLRSLEQRAFLRSDTKKGIDVYEITPEGKAWLKAQKPKSTRARAAKPAAATAADLAALEARLNARFDQILARLSGGAGADVESVIAQAIQDANKEGAHRGLVPIPAVRRLVVQRAGVPRAKFDELLLDLERRFLVDLKIADDPRRPDGAEGIHVPGRGLVYFILAR